MKLAQEGKHTPLFASCCLLVVGSLLMILNYWNYRLKGYMWLQFFAAVHPSDLPTNKQYIRPPIKL